MTPEVFLSNYVLIQDVPHPAYLRVSSPLNVRDRGPRCLRNSHDRDDTLDRAAY